MNDLIKFRKKVVEMGIKILSSNLTVGTWGNISSRIAETENIVITPTGMNYETLTQDDIVELDMHGNIRSGERKPSIELPLHLAIYNARKDVQAIVHTHSVFASAMAVARKEIPGAVEDMVQIAGGNIRVSEYALPGSVQLGINTVNALDGRNAALLANHGMIGVGQDLEEAFKVCQVVEKGAQIMLFASLIGGAVQLTSHDIEEMRNFYLYSYGQR
jgi:L-fuculose-phosphate aldolase